MSAAVFIVGEMAGSGVLALPRAAVDAGIFLIYLINFNRPNPIINMNRQIAVNWVIYLEVRRSRSYIPDLNGKLYIPGWMGIVLVIVFCINAGYGGSRLGACWEILEERYADYRKPVRNPYATIAYRAIGNWGR